MLNFFVTATISVSLMALISSSAEAADKIVPPNGDHPFTRGSVWKISYVQTKPGKLDDYLNDAAHVFERYQEKQKAAGRVLSYKILQLTDARDNEPNLLLMIEYPNYAVLDTPDAVWDQGRKELFGNIKGLNTAAVDREALRTLRGDVYAQELKVPLQK